MTTSTPPPTSTSTRLTLALISEIYPTRDDWPRLVERLREARAAGADVAVLPEMPLNPWSPAFVVPKTEDAEGPDGPRAIMQARAARDAGIGLIGGVILRDPVTGVRHNTALAFDATGTLRGSFAKTHLPNEPGFFETAHFEPGETPPTVIDGLGWPVGIQMCSDVNRPEGTHLLAAQGARAVIAPRTTEAATFDRWRIVFQASAITSCVYIASVNRPIPEEGVQIGGPSIVVAPDGAVILETTETVGLATLEVEYLERARVAYPGYLPVRADLYARGWTDASRSGG